MTNRLPRQMYCADQVRRLDRLAIQKHGIEGFTLMQRAAAVAFSNLIDRWPQVKHVIVFAGTGNNGGDGYVLAGIARDHGLNPALVLLGEHGTLKSDALKARQYAQSRGVIGEGFDKSSILERFQHPSGLTVIVDALLGTGLDRPVTGTFAEAIGVINTLNYPVLSIDVPSGLSSDTGVVLGVAVKAQATITFIGLKQGLLTADGVEVCGEIIYQSLDVPEEVFTAVDSPPPTSHRIDMNQMSRMLLPRLASAHKGDFGHTVVVGGDYGYSGAALMAAEAAIRTGAGLVSLITRSVNRSAVLARRPEIMLLGTEDSADEVLTRERIEGLLGKASVVVLGPGLGISSWSRELFRRALQLQIAKGIPVVVDADALNLLAEQSEIVGSHKRNNWILTPHPGEAARLLHCETTQIQQDRFAAVVRLQERFGGVCLLKGAGSLICFPNQERQCIELCSEGNPGMASGGMGDVLSGVIGGLVSQGFTLADSLRLATCIHGESADLAAAEGGQRGMVATDLLPYIRQLVNPEILA